MKALTIWQPWASAIADGHKTIENRNWQTYYRGPVAIHAGAGAGTKSDFEHAVARVAELSGHSVDFVLARSQVRGAIIAVAELKDVCGDSLRYWWMSPLHCDCGPWAESQSRHFRLANVRRLINPIPVKGALNLWTVPDELHTLIDAELSAAATPGRP